MGSVSETPPPHSLYAIPRAVDSVDDCRFYHTMDLPGVGLQRGPWDLRNGITDYLGRVAFGGKRVLEIGTASGFVCFEMERRGAEVVAYDLSDETGEWDLVPFGGVPPTAFAAERSQGMRQINNSFWFAHAALSSKARMVYGPVYEVPAGIGPVDVAVFGSVLLHIRDPFLALQRALHLTRESVIVTEPASRSVRALSHLPRWTHLPVARSARLPTNLGFLPNPRAGYPCETWWRITPWTITTVLEVLGFRVNRLLFHTQIYEDHPTLVYTVVGKRDRATAPIELPS